MWKLENFRLVFIVVGLVGVLLFASPSFALFLHLPGGERFSELWILGPEHMAEGYPFNVTENESYHVYLGIGNHLGRSAYYAVYVKFRNQTEPLPNYTLAEPSSLPVLFEYRALVSDGASWEGALDFSFSNVAIAREENRSSVGSLKINDVVVNVDKVALWDAEDGAFYYELFMELWLYDVASDGFVYHNRFVGLWFNMTS